MEIFALRCVSGGIGRCLVAWHSVWCRPDGLSLEFLVWFYFCFSASGFLVGGYGVVSFFFHQEHPGAL